MYEIALTSRNTGPGNLLRGEILLLALGIEPQNIASWQSRSAIKLSIYLTDRRDAEKKLTHLQTKLEPGWHASMVELSENDYLTKWQTDYKPSPFGRRFTVVPLWEKSKWKGRRTPIYIDPKGTFGSGTHRSTRLAAQFMESLPRFESFLDVGCGTGVLMILARHLGATKLVGVENDPRAAKTAVFNVKQNGIRNAAVKRMDAAEIRKLGKFDVVAANLISKTLVDNQSALAACVGSSGYLALSGIEKKNRRWFLSSFKPAGLKRIRTIFRGGWCGFLYRRIG